MISEYEQHGYVVRRSVFKKSELVKIKNVLSKFHLAWQKDNQPFYQKKAINSAYLTGTKYLAENDRQKLFQLIGSKKISEIIGSIIPCKPMFINTQLFFNPTNSLQKNYWHRDTQYDLSMEEQKQALLGPKVMHLRIPLNDEPGLELISGTHKKWDSELAFDIRMEKNGKKNHQDIADSVKIKLDAGDYLIFSANMIHRGLYGMDRFALDILFCDSDKKLAKFINKDCLPNDEIMANLDDPRIFANSYQNIK